MGLKRSGHCYIEGQRFSIVLLGHIAEREHCLRVLTSAQPAAFLGFKP